MEDTISVPMTRQQAIWVITLMSKETALLQENLPYYMLMALKSKNLILGQLGTKGANDVMIRFAVAFKKQWPDTEGGFGMPKDNASVEEAIQEALKEAGLPPDAIKRVVDKEEPCEHCACDPVLPCCYCGKVHAKPTEDSAVSGDQV